MEFNDRRRPPAGGPPVTMTPPTSHDNFHLEAVRPHIQAISDAARARGVQIRPWSSKGYDWHPAGVTARVDLESGHSVHMILPNPSTLENHWGHDEPSDSIRTSTFRLNPKKPIVTSVVGGDYPNRKRTVPMPGLPRDPHGGGYSKVPVSNRDDHQEIADHIANIVQNHALQAAHNDLRDEAQKAANAAAKKAAKSTKG